MLFTHNLRARVSEIMELHVDHGWSCHLFPLKDHHCFPKNFSLLTLPSEVVCTTKGAIMMLG